MGGWVVGHILLTAIRNITFMALMNTDALGVSVFIGIGIRRRIAIHRNRMRWRILIPMNRDTPAYPYSSAVHPYSYE